MDLVQLHNKLIAAVRTAPPSEAVPLAFEKRILARLRAPVLDHWAQWSRALWRAAISCVGIVLLLGVWAAFAPKAGNSTVDLSQELDNTLLAAVDTEQPADSP